MSNRNYDAHPELEPEVDGDDMSEPAPAQNEPPAGSWASVARLMASLPSDPNEPPIDWDAWKDQMKDEDMARDEAMGM